MKDELVRRGKNTWIGENVRLFGEVEIGDGTIIEHNVTIGAPSSEELEMFKAALAHGKEVGLDRFVRQKTIIGRDCTIRAGTVICSGVIIDDGLDCYNGVLVGSRTEIGKNVYIMSSARVILDVRIGDNVRLAGFCANGTVVEDDASMLGNLVHKYKQARGGLTEDSPRVKRGAVVGMLALVIGGVTVGEGAYVGAGAVVTKDVPSGCLVVGNPAREIKKLLY